MKFDKLPFDMTNYINSYLIQDNCTYCSNSISRCQNDDTYLLFCNYICCTKHMIYSVDFIITTSIIMFFTFM